MPRFSTQPLESFDDFERFLGQFTNYERRQFFSYDKETLGLSRVRALATDMGDPHLAYPTVHVAGTKGKGSTSLLLESLLRASGYRVGTYTSPHVEHLSERVRVDGEPITLRLLLDEVNSLLPLLGGRSQEEGTFPTFFELMTALAMGVFRRRRVDWGIFEVGLGGRLDATNIVAPSWTVITSIELEHTAQLGRRLGQIAGEKAGIIKPGVTVVIGPMPPEANEEIRRLAAARDAPVISVPAGRVRAGSGAELWLEDLDAPVPAGPVVGPGLRTDLGLALEVYRAILAADGKEATRQEVSAALQALVLPARSEFLGGEPCVVLDSAHTAESLGALGAALDEQAVARPRTVVFALAKSKQVASVLERLRLVGDELIFTRADEARSLPPADLLRAYGSGEVVERPEDAFARAVARGAPVVITGSFYLSGRLRAAARRHAARSVERAG